MKTPWVSLRRRDGREANEKCPHIDVRTHYAPPVRRIDGQRKIEYIHQRVKTVYSD